MISLRKITATDGEQIRTWRNSEKVRLSMSDQEPISYQDHHAWLSTRLEDPANIALIAEQSSTPVGFMQFSTLNPEVAEWGFYKSPDAGAGIGRAICSEAIEWAKQHLPVSSIVAKVVSTNAVSLKLHLGIGFELISEETWLRLTGYEKTARTHKFFRRSLRGPG